MFLVQVRTILPRQICCGNPHFAERDERMDDDASLRALNSKSVVGDLVVRPAFVMDLWSCGPQKLAKAGNKMHARTARRIGGGWGDFQVMDISAFMRVN